MREPLRFDAAFDAALVELGKYLPKLASNGEPVLLVRDVLGCFRILIAGEYAEGIDHREFSTAFADKLGKYSVPAERLVQRVDSDHPLYELFKQPDAWPPLEGSENLCVLDRLVTGREWLLGETENRQPTPPRAVFFGLKGGVGRSTALSMLARHLSGQGKKVLVIDLDLESPGLGPILLPTGMPQEGDTCVPGWPSYGVTDWFVEDAAGQADDDLLKDMYSRSELATIGDIFVVPACGGLLKQDYIAKLSRVYLDLPRQTGGVELFGDRLSRLLDRLESHLTPDVVLIDCRAGLHDISSAALTRLGALNFLFAVDTRQTWEGYRHLFLHWQRNLDHLRVLREKLLTVAALVPTGEKKEDYRRAFCDRASDVFSEIYDDSGTAEAFNFVPEAEDAPHYPSLIRKHSDYDLFFPLEHSVQLDAELIRFAFGEFLTVATVRLFPENEAT